MFFLRQPNSNYSQPYIYFHTEQKVFRSCLKEFSLGFYEASTDVNRMYLKDSWV